MAGPCVWIILAVAVLCPQHAFSATPDMRSQFHRHHVVIPRISSNSRVRRDLSKRDEVTVAYRLQGVDLTLHLRRNTRLFPARYFETFHSNGSRVVEHPKDEDGHHCYYQGSLDGHGDSWAAVSLCAGTVSGVVYDGTEVHYIEPEPDGSPRHLVFHAADIKPSNLTCGYKDGEDILNPNRITNILKRATRSTAPRPYRVNHHSRYVELVLVNDHREYIEQKRQRKVVFERSKQIANIVNGLYAPLNIFVALVGVVVWSEHDEISLSSDGDDTLKSFLHYRRERLSKLHPNDNAQLITGTTFDGEVVGKALKGPICTYKYSGGVNMDHSRVVGLVATTVAHELGHNFGMEHDTDRCHCPDSKCIMAPSSSSSSPRHWSSCSLDLLQAALDRGMDHCLRNPPAAITGPSCGNGFLEPGEECDCGLEQFCDSLCCDAATCRLHPNATCATGSCCDLDTCQLRPAATPCRPSQSECDLPEYCPGDSPFCPEDVGVQDGAPCRQAWCYRGRCRSHADQCRLLWGPTGRTADMPCFLQNLKGNVNGHCGYSPLNDTYVTCRREDVLCGMLHCTHQNEKLEFGMESSALLAHSYLTVRGKTVVCRSAVVDLGITAGDPGLAPSGAKCGEHKMCVGQRCMPVEEIRGAGCPHDCNQNGVCNSKGNCHCLVGFTPPFCDLPGPGGSVNSGPASDPDVKYQVLRATFYLVLMVMVPLTLLAALAVCIFRRREVVWWVSARRKSKKTDNSVGFKPEPKSPTKRKQQSQENVGSLPPKPPLSRGSFRNVDISEPVLQNSTKNIAGLPLRTSPERTLSWTPGSMRTRVPINRRTGRPISIPSSRPACPPPKPPPPKVATAKPPTTFYDDCHNYLDFSDTPLAFIHSSNDEKQPLAPSTSTGGKVIPKSAAHTTSPSNNINQPYSNYTSGYSEHVYNIVESPKHSHSPSVRQNTKPISTIYQNTMNNLETSNFSKKFSKDINIPSASSSNSTNPQSASSSSLHKLNPQSSTFTGSSQVVPTVMSSGEMKPQIYPTPHSKLNPGRPTTFSPLSTTSLATFIPTAPRSDGIPEGKIQPRLYNPTKVRGSVSRSNSGAGIHARGPATIHRPYSSGGGLQAVPVSPPSLSSLPGYKSPGGRVSPRRSPATSKLVLTAIPAADNSSRATRVATLTTKFEAKPPICPSKPKPS